MAASLADEQRLEIGQSDSIRPAASVDHDRMRAFVIAAVDDEPGRARLAHLSDGDFLSARHEQRSKRTRVKLAGCASPWGVSGMSQALDSRPFLAQAPFQKSALKVCEIGFKQPPISTDVVAMGAQTGEFLVGHGASV
jgi:hypothetical protein